MPMDASKLLSALESSLFVSGEPLSYARLSKTLDIPEEEVREGIRKLAEKYAGDETGGLIVIENNRQVLIATKTENAPYIESLTKSALQETLSKAALEVLAIIAYRAPITRAEIEAVRGVNCSFTIRNLLLRDLVERQGNPDDSRGYVYRPSFRFLQVLGLRSAEELPDYPALSQDERLRMILEGDTSAGNPEENSGGITETKNEE